MTELYRRPDEYDLEHAGDEEDVAFYVALARSLRPKSVLELACGTGRITVPLAEEGARSGFSVVGLDSEANMLKQARDKAARMPAAARKRLRLVQGDMRKWHVREAFDLIVVPCASITHLLELQDQLEVWRRAFHNLAPGGRFVVEATMPNFSAYADSFANPVAFPTHSASTRSPAPTYKAEPRHTAPAPQRDKAHTPTPHPAPSALAAASPESQRKQPQPLKPADASHKRESSPPPALPPQQPATSTATSAR